MRAYSLDLRERVVAAVAGGASCQEAARRFAVGRSTVQRWVVQQAQTGSLAPRPILGRHRKIGPAEEAALRAQVQAAPDAPLAEHCATWQTTHGVHLSLTGMHRALARLGWPLKKSPSAPLSKTPRRARPIGTTRSSSIPPAVSSSTRPVRRST
jgi:transposase